MPRSLPQASLADRKIDLIFKMYVSPGDQDYITARWAYGSALFHAFYWCAAQAAEKYMKAFILLQDEPATKYKHDLTRLFQAVCARDLSGVMPGSLDIPRTSATGRDQWHEKPMRLYLEYLNFYGSSDNRYAVNGTFVNGPILHALDIFCVAMRRLIRTTNLTGGDLFINQSRGLMAHEHIELDQDWMIDPSLLLEQLFVGRYSVGGSAEIRRTFSNMNFAFFMDRAEDEKSFGGQHYHGSPLYNHLVRLGEIYQTVENQEIVKELREWARKNIHMSSSLQIQLGLK